MKVDVHGDSPEDLASAIREFSKKVKKNGILLDLRKKEHYVKPGQAKRLQRAEAIRRKKREERENSKYAY